MLAERPTRCGSPAGAVVLGTNLRVFLVSATDDVVKVEVWDVVDKGKVHFLLNALHGAPLSPHTPHLCVLTLLTLALVILPGSHVTQSHCGSEIHRHQLCLLKNMVGLGLLPTIFFFF